MALLTLLLFATAVKSHTWGEEQHRIALNGTFVGPTGFARGYMPRSQNQNQGWLIPNGHSSILPTDKLFDPARSKLTDAMYSKDFPMLTASPGDFAAFMYTENGHVSKQDIEGGNPKPINRGTVYVYGTQENDLSNYNLVDVHLKWTRDGTGGDGKGRLLATRNFDDGQCFEPIPADGDKEGITTFRMTHLKKEYQALSCQTDIQIPLDAKVGKPYTIIWTWDWGTLRDDLRGLAVPPASYNASEIKIPEIYVSVADYKIVDPCDPELGEVKGTTCNNNGQPRPVQFAEQPDPARSGIRAQMEDLWMVHVPQAGFNVTEAQAPETKIPLALLIGVTEPVTEAISPEKLLDSPAKPNLNLGAGSEDQEPPSPSVTVLPSSVSESRCSAKPTPPPTTSSPPPTTSSPATGGDNDDGILTVTVTVPQTTVFVTSTKTATAKATPDPQAASSKPTATASKRSNLRRTQGEWAFGTAR